MEGKKERCTAVILAGGCGGRMKSSVAKQYLSLGGKPILWYSLQAVQESRVIDDCILVTGEADREFVRRQIVEPYQFTKVRHIIAGGTRRCWSVANALAFLEREQAAGEECRKEGYVFIHDSARPFLTEEILRRTYEGVKAYHACVAAMPSKDTVKLADGDGFAASTPDRSRVWTVQTPQVFEAGLILDAYDRLRRRFEEWDHAQESGREPEPPVTDGRLLPEHQDHYAGGHSSGGSVSCRLNKMEPVTVQRAPFAKPR